MNGNVFVDTATEERHEQRRGEIRRRQHPESRGGKREETAPQEGRDVVHTRFPDRSDHNESVRSSKHCEIHRHYFRQKLQVHCDGTLERRGFERVFAQKPSFSGTYLYIGLCVEIKRVLISSLKKMWISNKYISHSNRIYKT